MMEGRALLIAAGPRIRICLIAAGMLMGPGCSPKAPPGDAIEAVEEAVFRYEFGHNGSVGQERTKVYFLAMGERLASFIEAGQEKFPR